MPKIDIPEDRKFLFGWLEVEQWSGMSTSTLKKLVECGLPGTLLHSNSPVFHKDNLNKFFEVRSNKSLKDIQEKINENK